MKRWTALGVLWATSAGAPAAPPLVLADELPPTRMVLCQREAAGVERDRNGTLRTCLARRLEGERIVERNCKHQAVGVSGANARVQAQRDCERLALSVPSSELPRRPPPKPKPPAAPDASAVTAAPRMPAAGDQ